MNGFNANTALYRQDKKKKRKEKGGEGPCFDTMLPNGWLGGGDGPSWSAYYACDV